MVAIRSLLPRLVPLLTLAAAAPPPTWTFTQGQLTLKSKQTESTSQTYFLHPNKLLPSATDLSLDATTGSIRITLTVQDSTGSPTRPHQAFLILQDPASGLAAPFPLAVRANGLASVDVPAKDLPLPLLTASTPLQASLILGSFGQDSAPLDTPLFSLAVAQNTVKPLPAYEPPLRYGPQPEIHHVFRPDPRSPPKVVSALFALAIVATVPALFFGWLYLGANIAHLPNALAAAPLSHVSFLASLTAIEFVFFLYYTSWNLFQTLPVVGLLGVMTVLSGTKTLGGVQSRRLAGQR